MCTNYENFIDAEFVRLFGVSLPPDEFKQEAYPGYLAPVIRNIMRKSTDDDGTLECIAARFGLVPHWAKPEDVAKPRMPFATYNARRETVATLASYKNAWKRRQFCLIPVKSFYEPNWETGKAVRWKLSIASGEPFALAGIWERWKQGDITVESFSMLTVNADDHPVMKRMHRPDDEKRMPVILLPDEYRLWLNATADEAYLMCRQFPADQMVAEAAPIPGKAKTLVA